MMDHASRCASLFTEVVHFYLPKLCILIYRSCVFLVTDCCVLLFTDYICWIEISILNLENLKTWLYSQHGNG